MHYNSQEIFKDTTGLVMPTNIAIYSIVMMCMKQDALMRWSWGRGHFPLTLVELLLYS